MASLERLLATVRVGGSAALLVRGDPGIGKSALLNEVTASLSGFNIVRGVGVEGEIELPYAGLHQLCRSMTDSIGGLPQPQCDALRVAFGLSTGEPADRYIVGLATLSLMSETAATRPLLCVIDDTQWLDPETKRTLAFVARRLGADSVGLLFASRETVTELEGIDELHLGGLGATDSLELFDSVFVGRIDAPVRERFLAETHGNPLALIELQRALTPSAGPDQVARRTRTSLSSRIEHSFRQQLEPLPDDTRDLLVPAALEPLGDPLLLLRAASHLGLTREAADAAEEIGLFEIRERCSFRHPLVRSAVYGAASQSERRLAHDALAAATDAELDPDRKAWHRAQATAAPDEGVALELERTAARAKARGGLAAAGAFLQRSAMLTPEPRSRTERALSAAEVMFDAAEFDSAETLLRSVQSSQLDDTQRARVELLQVEVGFGRGQGDKEGVLRLLAAAHELRELDPSRGDAAHLEVLRLGYTSGIPDVITAISDALSRYRSSDSRTVVGLMVRGWAQLIERGFPAGTGLIREAVEAMLARPEFEESDLPLLEACRAPLPSMWDFETWQMLLRRTVQLARDCGALTFLARALGSWSDVNVAAGEFSAAEMALAEAQAVAEATGVRNSPYIDSSLLDALRLKPDQALLRIDVVAQNLGALHFSYFYHDYVRAIVYNAAGLYQPALEAAQRSSDRHPLGTYSWALVELVEAATRCGEHERARVAFGQLTVRTRLSSSDWGLGLEARSAALVNDDPIATEARYREAIELLGRARTRPDLARAHLLYGEWLRREKRRVDARGQLRIAHDMFTDIGIPGFAERARIELAATGETVRKRTDDTRADLTAQEGQIAQLAAEGMTNPEIGAKLFISARTVEWHLAKVYPKLGVTSRKDLRIALRPT